MFYKSLLTEIVWHYRYGDNDLSIPEWKKVMDETEKIIGYRIEYWVNKKTTELNYIKGKQKLVTKRIILGIKW